MSINMTKAELKLWKRDKKDPNSFVVSVVDHKTEHKGPVNIGVSGEIVKYLNIYVAHFRDALTDINEGESQREMVFVTYEGASMSSSLAHKQFRRFWEKATGKKDSKITATIIRKYTERQCCDIDPTLKRHVADHLNHSEKTAEDNYVIYDKMEKAVGISKAVINLQRGIEPTMKTKTEIIPVIFKDEIEEGFITLSKVKAKMCEVTAELPDITENDCKSITDMIQMFIKKNKVRYASISATSDEQIVNGAPCTVTMNESPECINHDDGPDFHDIQSTTISMEQKRKDYTDEDNFLICNHLRNYITRRRDRTYMPINRKIFEVYVKEIPEIADIVEKRGVSSIIVKVRTERKKQEAKWY